MRMITACFVPALQRCTSHVFVRFLLLLHEVRKMDKTCSQFAGKGNYVFTIDHQKWDAATWKKVLMLEEPTWGIDVPSCRIQGHSPTFGSLILFFFRKSTTRSYYLMHFSQSSMRGAEIWHIWKQHHVIECFWKIMKSIFHMRSMQLQDDGLYTALLIKVFAYLLALRLQAQRVFSKIGRAHV